MTADLPDHDVAAVDPHPDAWPARVLLGDRGQPALQLERRTRGPNRVIRLIASVVEHRHQRVTDELLDLAAEPPRDQRRGGAPVGVEHGRDLGRRRLFREGREVDEIGEEDADLLMPGAGRRQVQAPKPLVAPLAAGGQADDHVRHHDQAVPLPPARMPLPLARDRDADHGLGQEQEAGDDRDRQQVPTVPEDAPVANGADRVDDRPGDRERRHEVVRRRFGVGPLERRQILDRPDEPRDHHGQHRDPEQGTPPNQADADSRPDVDEGRGRREDRAHEQPHRDCDLEPGMLLREEDRRRSDRMQPEEASGRHERQREEQNASIAPPVGGLARRVAERDCDRADEPEDDEVQLVVLDMRVELGA